MKRNVDPHLLQSIGVLTLVIGMALDRSLTAPWLSGLVLALLIASAVLSGASIYLLAARHAAPPPPQGNGRRTAGSAMSTKPPKAANAQKSAGRDAAPARTSHRPRRGFRLR